MVRLVGVEDVRGDEAFLETWRALERDSLEPNPFFAPHMVLPAARHLDGGARARLLVDEDAAGRLRFLLPVVDAVPWNLARRTVPLAAMGVGLTGLRTWSHPYCFLGTPLIDAAADAVAVWRDVLAAVPRLGRRPWLELPDLSTDGPVAVALAAVHGADPSVVHHHLGSRGLARRRPEPTYVQEWVSGKNRANLARRRRKLAAELGTVLAFDRGCASNDFDDALEQFLALESAGWKGRGGSAVSQRENHTQFARDTLRAFAEDKRLVFLSLEAPGQTVAQSLSLLAGRGQFGFKKAYDEQWARCSPGALLDVEVLEHFHRADELEFIDTCSDPRKSPTDFFGDRRPMHDTVIPTSWMGRRAVPWAFPRLARMRDDWRGTRVGALVLRALGRGSEHAEPAPAEARPVAAAA